MSAASPESLTLLNRAAELRAAGTPWSDAAKQLGYEHDELRRIVDEHDHRYERLARRARTEFRIDAYSEAIAALRTLAKSSDPDQSRHASTTILRFEMTRLRYGATDADEKLDRRPRRKPPTRTAEAGDERVENMSESTEVPVQKEVVATEKVTQSSVPPAAPKPAPTPANKSPLSEAERRKQRPATSAPVGCGQRTMQSWLGG